MAVSKQVYIFNIWNNECIMAYTSRHSRFNEQNELSKCYVKFNLQQLVKAAVNVCEGAQYCAL